MDKLKEYLKNNSEFYLFEEYDEEIGKKVYQYLIAGKFREFTYDSSYYNINQEELDEEYLIKIAFDKIIKYYGERKIKELFFFKS